MKRVAFLFSFVVALLFGGCSQHKIIPDDELAMIFRDAFLANAYTTTQGIQVDSLNLYEPIFKHHGYTTDDVQYTIGNFSKRKSARLGDVVERAITMLEDENAYLSHEVAILDTIDHVARKFFMRPLLRDSLIRVYALKDSMRLRFTLDSIRPGDYTVRVRYLVDSTDENQYLRASAWFERAGGGATGNYTITLRRESKELFEHTFVADTSERRLIIDFWQLQGKRKRPHMTLQHVEVDYTPPAREVLDSLYERQLNLRIFTDEFIRCFSSDSLPQATDAARHR
ncbi:MAG: DUF4296 domain-containing protein [Alistipes sp.]